MASRRKRTTPKKPVFMVVNEDGDSCCGQEFSSYASAEKEAITHAKENVGGSYCRVTQVVAEVFAKPAEVVVTVDKV